MAKWSRKRQNKDGTFSYTFRVYRGYTPEGERLKPYVYTWKSPAGLTERPLDYAPWLPQAAAIAAAAVYRPSSSGLGL